jgi:hypothetical protein
MGLPLFNGSFLAEIEDELETWDRSQISYHRISHARVTDVLLRLRITFGDSLYFLTDSISMALRLIAWCVEVDPLGHITLQVRRHLRGLFVQGIKADPLFGAHHTLIHFHFL